MSSAMFDEKDRQQVQAHGLTRDEVDKQIRIFEKGAPYADLDRPCTVGDGIRRIEPEEAKACAADYEKEGAGRFLTKFVPASGAATRMFKALLKISGDYQRIERDVIAKKAAEEGEEYEEVLEFIDNIDKFAFYERLSEAMASDGHDMEALRNTGDFTLIVSYVLGSRGLRYASRPKGQILFHRYPDGARTAFEEHLVEAAEYAADARGNSYLHFTVSPEHESGFTDLLEKKGPSYEKDRNVRFHARFSHQRPSTDTIAVEMDNRPFRDEEGKLLFRPGGHGALLGNLNELDGDIVFIKNIDNVVPDSFKPETIFWKKVLAGYLLRIERDIQKHRSRIRSGDTDKKALGDALQFIEKQLGVLVPEEIQTASPEKTGRYLMERLDRPLRVCGMVPTSGEAGGGPFWVKSPDGSVSIQIVESAQIDPESPLQQEILKQLTHFNPVDIVCSLRNEDGEPYDLSRFVDTSAVFISRKSKDGRELKALEHPGLWNGAMAYWNTVFVEVPLITFNPVKTVNDLLRDTHQG